MEPYKITVFVWLPFHLHSTWHLPLCCSMHQDVFPFITEQYCCIDIPILCLSTLYQLMDALNCFHLWRFWLLLNNVAINIHVQSFCIAMFYFSYIPRIAVSYGNSNKLTIWVNCQPTLKSSCTILHSHHSHKRVPVFLHPHHIILCYHLFYFHHPSG